MSRKFRLKGVDLGADLQNLEIYHTSIDPSNLLIASITASVLASTGVEVEVDDDVNSFYAKCLDGDCENRTGSLVIDYYVPNTRFFTVVSDGEGYISSILPEAKGPVTSSFDINVNYSVDSLLVLEADNSYYPGYEFQGWYNDVSGSGDLISTNTQISIGQYDYTDNLPLDYVAPTVVTPKLTNDTIYAYFG